MNAFLQDFKLLQADWPEWKLEEYGQGVPDDHCVVISHVFCGGMEDEPDVTTVRVEVSPRYPRGISRCILLSNRVHHSSTSVLKEREPIPLTSVINGLLSEGIDHVLEVFIRYKEEMKALYELENFTSGTPCRSPQVHLHDTFQKQLYTVIDAQEPIRAAPSEYLNSSDYSIKRVTTTFVSKASKYLLELHMRGENLDGLCDAFYDEKIMKFVVNIGIPLSKEGMSELRCRALGLTPLKRFFITTFHFPPEYVNCTSRQQVSVVGVYLSDSIKLKQRLTVSDLATNMSEQAASCDPRLSSFRKRKKNSNGDIYPKGATEVDIVSPGDTGTAKVRDEEPVGYEIAGPLPWLIQTRVQEALLKNETMKEWKLTCLDEGCEGIEKEERVKSECPKGRSKNSGDINTSGVGCSKTGSISIVSSKTQTPITPDVNFVFPEEQFYHNPNILEGLRCCIEHRLRMCTERCLLCDDFLGVATVKIGVCKKELCAHIIENYAICCNVLTEITERPLVCELLIFLSFAAAKTGHVRDTFDPMCTVHLQELQGAGEPESEINRNSTAVTTRPLLSSIYSPSKSKSKRTNAVTSKLHFYEEVYGGQKKDFALLEETISLIPPIQRMILEANGSNTALKAYLNTISPLLFPLLHWILASNHAHVEPIPPRLRFNDLGEYQFYLVTSNPEKEKRFREHRKKAKELHDSDFYNSGSFFAWHGSSPGNWHCILRNGLKNYSGTKLMSAGQLYGGGIYTALSMGVSVPYMGQPVSNWPGAEYINGSHGFLVLALCEVAAARTGWKKHPNGIVTVQDEDLISTRFLFLFPNGFPNENMDKVIVKVPRELLVP